MRSANPIRGEVALEVAGHAWMLRPTFSALVAAERELGSLFALLERAGAGNVALADMVTLMWHCVVEPELPRHDFETAMAAAGLLQLLAPYRALFRAIFDG